MLSLIYSVRFRRIPRPHASVLSVCALLILTAGCQQAGDPVGTVTGKVTIASQPVTEGNIIFENPDQGWIRVSPLGTDGRYRLDDVRVGEYIVTVQPPEPTLPNENTHSPAEIRAAIKPVSASAGQARIPRQFHVSQTSPLKCNVADGSNTMDFELAEHAR